MELVMNGLMELRNWLAIHSGSSLYYYDLAITIAKLGDSSINMQWFIMLRADGISESLCKYDIERIVEFYKNTNKDTKTYIITKKENNKYEISYWNYFDMINACNTCISWQWNNNTNVANLDCRNCWNNKYIQGQTCKICNRRYPSDEVVDNVCPRCFKIALHKIENLLEKIQNCESIQSISLFLDIKVENGELLIKQSDSEEWTWVDLNIISYNEIVTYTHLLY